MLRNLKLIFGIAFTVAAVIIALQNTEVMTTHVLVWDITMSRSVMLFMTFVFGFLAGLLWEIFVRERQRMKSKAK